MTRRKRPLELASYHQIKTLILSIMGRNNGRCRVLMPGNCATLVDITNFICREAQSIAAHGHLELVSILPMGSPDDMTEASNFIEPITGFPGRKNRDALNEGNGLIFLDNLSNVVTALADDWHADLIIGHAAEEKDGLFSMTLDGSLMRIAYLKQIAGRETIRVMVVNKHMPRAAVMRLQEKWLDPAHPRYPDPIWSEVDLVTGCAIHRNDIDYLIYHDAPLLTFKSVEGGKKEVWEKIAKQPIEAGLIIPGKTDCQVGVGSSGLFWSVLAESGITDVGCDSELGSEELALAIEKGVVTSRNRPRSSAFYGKHILGIVAGGPRLNALVHDNPSFAILDQHWVNRYRWRGDHSFGFNAGLLANIFGDVASTSYVDEDGHVIMLSANGGQQELILLIVARPYGNAVIGLPSRRFNKATKQYESTIRATLGDARVTTPAECGHHLATEHGIVKLRHGDTLHNARAIIETLVHPDFREEVAREAQKRYPHLRRLYPVGSRIAA